MKKILLCLFIIGVAWLSSLLFFRWERLLRLEENMIQLAELKPWEYTTKRYFVWKKMAWHTDIMSEKTSHYDAYVFKDLVNFNENITWFNVAEKYKKHYKKYQQIITEYNFTHK